jgi:hypothetical protein
VIAPEVRLPVAGPTSLDERFNPVDHHRSRPPQSSLTAVAVQPDGLSHPPIRVQVTSTTRVALQAWAEQWPDRQWAVEGATGLGRGIAQQLAAAGEVVIDVPPKLAARARLLGSGNARKTDVTDAASVAAVAQRNARVNRVQPEGHTTRGHALSMCLSGIGSPSAVRHSGAWKGSAKYCVSCTTFA